MKESVILRNRNKLMKCNETRHYKMYKAGKNFLFASISMMAMGSWMFLNQTAYADVKPSVSITAQIKTPTSSTNSDQAGTRVQLLLVVQHRVNLLMGVVLTKKVTKGQALILQRLQLKQINQHLQVLKKQQRVMRLTIRHSHNLSMK